MIKARFTLFVALMVGLMASGCKTTERGAFDSFYTLTTAVDAAMNAYGDAVKLGRVSQADQAKVKILHDNYRAILIPSLRLARFDFQQSTPSELAVLASELTLVIGAILE